MRYTVAEVALIAGGELHGDASVVITGVASLESARAGDLTFATREHLVRAASTAASAIVLPQVVPALRIPQIVTAHPYLAFSRFLREVERERADLPQGIHPTAVVDPTAALGPEVALGPCAVVGARACIGARSRIGAHVVIGADCTLGEDVLIYPNVTIRERVRIGNRVIIHSGTTIGGDGFGYIQYEGRHVKVPQVGTVEIGDDVEIGCNCTIDRATMEKTVIGRGVKMDNHCHIAHNCIIGEDCLLVAYARIGGGTILGKGVLLAEDVGVTDHVKLGDGCIIGGTGKVSKDVPAGAIWWGNPAQDIKREKRERAALRRLPELFERVKELEKRLK